MNSYNQMLLDTVISKVQTVYKEDIDLVAICGSCASGDEYEKSDLDLLIVVNNEKGYEISTCFILDDPGVGFDFYCYDWSRLENEAEVHSAYLTKVLNSMVVYVRNQEQQDHLELLRKRTREVLESDLRLDRAEEALKTAKQELVEVLLSENISRARTYASYCMSALFDTIMLYHGQYFHRGVKWNLEELHTLKLDPWFFETIDQVLTAGEIPEILSALRSLTQYTEKLTKRPQETPIPSVDNIQGSYEEMFSNWRNKVEAAAKVGDRYASFMNLCGLQMMIEEMAEFSGTEAFSVMDRYDPENLAQNLIVYDEALVRYKENYDRLGMTVRRYPDAAAFSEQF